jgi:hypothetical protein
VLKAFFWLLLVGLVAYVFILPAIARGRVLAALRRIDPSAGVELRHVSPRRLQLANLTLGDAPWLTADVVDITYDLGLLRGRLGTVRAEGVEWRVHVRNGEVDAGFVGGGRGSEEDALRLVRRLELRHAAVVVDTDGGQFRVPLDVTLTTRGPDEHHLSASGAGIVLKSDDSPVALYNAALMLETTLDRRLEPTGLTGELRADRIELAGLALLGATIACERDSKGRIRFRARAGAEPAGNWLVQRGIMARTDSPLDVSGGIELDLGGPGDATESPSWGLRVTEGRASFEGWRFAADRAGTALRGVGGRVNFEATADADRIALRLQGGSDLFAQALEGGAAGPVPETADSDRPQLTLTIDEPGGLVSVSRDESPPSWQATAGLRLQVHDADVAVVLPALGRILAERLGVDLGVVFTADSEALTIASRGEGSLTLAALRTERGDLSVTDPVRATVTAIGDQPLLALSKSGADRCGSARMRVADTVSFMSPAVVASLGGLEVSGSACWHAGEEPMLDVNVAVTDASARLPAAELAVDGIDMRIPVTTNVAGPDEGEFTLAQVRGRGRALGPAAGRIAVRDGQLAATGRMVLPGGLPMNARGRLERSADQLVGELQVETPRSAVEDPGAFARVLGLGPGATVGGTWSLEADLALEDKELESLVRVEVTEGSLGLPDQELEAEHISGALTFDRLSPLSTRGGEQLTIGAGRLGKVEFRDVAVTFSLEGPGALLVEQAQWLTGDSGRVSAAAFRLDLGQPVVETILSVERLRLGYWLGLLTDGRATGQGLLYGRLPVTFRPGAEQS